MVYTGRLTWLTVESLYKLVAREVPLKSLGGPILIAQVAGKQAEMGVTYLVQFMAALSVNLFLLNLLPIPVLDGGHLFFFTLEAIRGKPLALKHREMAQGLGLMLILALMILVFYQDILRLVQPASIKAHPCSSWPWTPPPRQGSLALVDGRPAAGGSTPWKATTPI